MPGAVALDASGRCRGGGAGLVASRRCAPGELLLGVPLSHCLVARRGGEGVEGGGAEVASPWNLALAEGLAGRAGTDWGCALPSVGAGPSFMGGAVDRTDVQMPAAWAEKAALEADFTAGCAASAARSGCTTGELKHAAALAHSRAFRHQGFQVIAPGIDFANHDFAPNCAVRTELDEAGGSGPQTVFELRAGEEGLEEGEEVTISYGPWCSEVMYLYYGFVVPGNPHEAVALFEGADDFVDFLARERLWEGSPAVKQNLAVVVEDRLHEAQVPGGRLQVLRGGIDESFLVASEVLGVDPLVACARRARELLEAAPTNLEQDAELLELGGLGHDVETAVRFRLEQKVLLAETLFAIDEIVPGGVA